MPTLLLLLLRSQLQLQLLCLHEDRQLCQSHGHVFSRSNIWQQGNSSVVEVFPAHSLLGLLLQTVSTHRHTLGCHSVCRLLRVLHGFLPHQCRFTAVSLSAILKTCHMSVRNRLQEDKSAGSGSCRFPIVSLQAVGQDFIGPLVESRCVYMKMYSSFQRTGRGHELCRPTVVGSSTHRKPQLYSNE